jgi:hypothetical protein
MRPQVVAGPSSAATSVVLAVNEKATPLRYRLQGRYYDLFLRNRTTPEKLGGQSQSGSTELELSETDPEATLGKRKARKRRKVFGCIGDRICAKVAKATIDKEFQKMSELSDAMEDTDIAKCFSECATSIQRTLSTTSASSLLSSCPIFFSKPSFLQHHMSYLAGQNDVFKNCVDHFEFQMELLYQYLLVKLPKKITARLAEEKDKDPAGNDLLAFYVSLLRHLADYWKMDFSKLFFEVEEQNKCHKDVPTPHAVVVNQEFSSINLYVDYTLIYRNLTLIQAIPAIVALHYATDVHYNANVHLLLEFLQKQICVLAPETGSHKPGKENFAKQSSEIQNFQHFIGHYLYTKKLSESKG